MSLQLQIENSSSCQAFCSFCPYPQATKTKGFRSVRFMPMELYKKILDEAATIPLFEHITLTGLGEPFLDKGLEEKVAYARLKRPYTMMDVFTNGNTLTVERGVALSDAGLDILYVSLNAVDAQKRFEVMGLKDYDKVVANTHALTDELVKTNRKMKVIVKLVTSKDLIDIGDIDLFLKEWGGPWNEGGQAYLHLEGNWGGSPMGRDGAIANVRTTQNKACMRALGEFMVLSDGRVSLCCFDSAPQVLMGDLNHQTIREIYASEKYVEYRQKHFEGRRSELFLCNNCTGI